MLSEDQAILERFIHANQINQFVIEDGVGPPIILLHGWPQTSHAWRKIIPGLARHYRVIAPDLRGLGKTDKPEGPYDMRTIATDIRALMEVLEVKSPYIIGHDWGGLAARRFSLDWPGKARRVAILDVAPHEQMLKDLNVCSALGLWHFFFLFQTELAPAVVKGREKEFLSHFFRNKCHNPKSFIPECIDAYTKAYAQPGAFAASIKYYDALFNENRALEQMPSADFITEPTLVLWGTSGGVGAVVDMLEIWRREANNLKGRGFDNCGHYMPEEIPLEVLAELLEFDERVD